METHLDGLIDSKEEPKKEDCKICGSNKSLSTYQYEGRPTRICYKCAIRMKSELAKYILQSPLQEDVTNRLCKCPTCGGDAVFSWSGLDLVANTGDETLASKTYESISLGEVQSTPLLSDSEVDQWIKNIHVDKGNLQHIAETGNINGTLLTELRTLIRMVARERLTVKVENQKETQEELWENVLWFVGKPARKSRIEELISKFHITRK